MIVSRGWAQSIALAEGHRLGAFVILHGTQRYRGDRARSGAPAERSAVSVGWGLAVQSSHGATAEASAPGWCCACKRGRACPDPGKHPMVIKGQQEHGHLDARSGRDICALITELRVRPINLGIVPAANMIVVDIDPRNDGAATLRSLEARYGPLPDTLGVYTGGGGEHRWFRTSNPGAHRVATLGPGIDLKHSGGLLVAPPSRHANTGHRGAGVRYQWRNTRLPPTMAPDWLEQISRKQETVSGGAHRGATGRPTDSTILVTEMGKATVGERAHSLFRLACWALRSDADLGPLIMAARGAGLTEPEIRRQVEGARRAVR